MFMIGQFAELTGVSAKRLRHYDRLELFRPAWVDPETRYRFYTATQLPDLRRIVSLVDLGLPLAEIAHLRRQGIRLEQALARRRHELERQRAELDRRLALLNIRIDRTHHRDIVIRRRPRGRWLSLRDTVERGAELAPLFDMAEMHVGAHDARAARPPVCVVHGSSETSRDIELLIPVDRNVPPTDRLATVTTRPADVAATLVVGGYEGLPEVVSELRVWAEAAGLSVAGPAWHVYLRFSADDYLTLPDEYLTDRRQELLTEVQLPLA